ncbi:MAG: nucleotide exchange factor GrpE [Gammaproteobacteria bacterium]|nr:nucleotide exchange factor GrpE [Gammaproteobacteria bacterium]
MQEVTQEPENNSNDDISPTIPPAAGSPETPVADALPQRSDEADKEISKEEFDSLSQQLEDALVKVTQSREQAIRMQAELENSQRRARRDIENAHKYGSEKLLQELLPVKDSLELGIHAATGDDAITAKFREGSELTLKLLTTVLEKNGVIEVNPLGELFNPALHQAVSMQESTSHDPNTVMMVMQKGYTLNERLVRPAMVLVSKRPAGSDNHPTIDATA